VSKILATKTDTRVDEVKLSLETFLADLSKQDRDLFSYQEIENMLLDIYNLIR
jgi:hypothetical protein